MFDLDRRERENTIYSHLSIYTSKFDITTVDEDLSDTAYLGEGHRLSNDEM